MSGVEHQENSEFLDLTDKENLEFRVSLLLSPIRYYFLTEPIVPVIKFGASSGWIKLTWRLRRVGLYSTCDMI